MWGMGINNTPRDRKKGKIKRLCHRTEYMCKAYREYMKKIMAEPKS